MLQNNSFDADWMDEVPEPKKTKGKTRSPEFKEQCKVAEYLRKEGILHTCSLAGLHLPLPALMKAKRAGYTRGTPDILVFVGRGANHGLLIEMKAKGGTVSEDQREWGRLAVRNGYRWAVCFSAKEAIEMIGQYMWGEI